MFFRASSSPLFLILFPHNHFPMTTFDDDKNGGGKERQTIKHLCKKARYRSNSNDTKA